MNPSLEVVRGKVARGALLLHVVRLLVADEGDQVRRLVVAEAALEDVGATAFRLHHLLAEIRLFGFVTFRFLLLVLRKTRFLPRGYRTNWKTRSLC